MCRAELGRHVATMLQHELRGGDDLTQPANRLCGESISPSPCPHIKTGVDNSALNLINQLLNASQVVEQDLHYLNSAADSYLTPRIFVATTEANCSKGPEMTSDK